MDDHEINVLDANYPLMTILREKAPGTHAHCKAVSSLVETVGRELGIESDYLKIAGMYHDIGKTINPEYFSENQTNGNNVLDGLDPWFAYRIITAHVGDTAQILINDPSVPRQVIEWCTQHHGTTVVKYFFKKSGSNSIDNYRYKCKRPTSLEAGLLMICDHLEARSKAMNQAGKLDNVENLVDLAINELMDDEQLDEITLKLGALRQIREILKRELRSQYHKRVDYDIIKPSIEVSDP